MTPKELLYSDGHEWLLQEGEIATVGITEYLQRELGDVLFIELPDVGDGITQGEPLGTIGAVEAVYELFAPISGEVLEVNEPLQDDPAQINNDPYGSWIIKLYINDLGELESLMPAEEYECMVER